MSPGCPADPVYQQNYSVPYWINHQHVSPYPQLTRNLQIISKPTRRLVIFDGTVGWALTDYSDSKMIYRHNGGKSANFLHLDGHVESYTYAYWKSEFSQSGRPLYKVAWYYEN